FHGVGGSACRQPDPRRVEYLPARVAALVGTGVGGKVRTRQGWRSHRHLRDPRRRAPGGSSEIFDASVPGATDSRARTFAKDSRTLVAMAQLRYSITQGMMIVPGFVGLGHTDGTALAQAGQPLPPSVQVRALIDSGCSVTAVSPSVFAQL